MNADDRPGPRRWSTSSPAEFDRLARGVLRAARYAARELRREPADPMRRTQALNTLAERTKAMLPDMPDRPPLGAAAQEGFVCTSLALALHVRAHSWAEADLGAFGVPGRADVPHPGERRAADAFDVLGRLMLPHASPEGWTATLVTDLARGDETLEAAVKLGKYVLHPTVLAILDDATRVIGEALHGLNMHDLEELAQSLWAYAWDLDPGAVGDADWVEKLLGLPAPLDDEPLTVPAPRLDKLPAEDEPQVRQLQVVGSVTYSLDQLMALQEAASGRPAQTDLDTDIASFDDLFSV
ncbi:hypothetical protein [Streptomyces sp. NPDC127038]|uniref:hypothetical protein n=1 Tax=Streptomyces sp. NPDC127038 TaxID=3347114 RepID=UPI00364FD219